MLGSGLLSHSQRAVKAISQALSRGPGTTSRAPRPNGSEFTRLPVEKHLGVAYNVLKIRFRAGAASMRMPVL